MDVLYLKCVLVDMFSVISGGKMNSNWLSIAFYNTVQVLYTHESIRVDCKSGTDTLIGMLWYCAYAEVNEHFSWAA